MSKRKVAKAEISLLSKRLKFVPTSNHINNAKLRMELEAYGRMLRLNWHFRNDEKEFDQNKFKPKSTFNPRNKDAAVEIYLSSLEENLMNIEIPQNKYSNLTREDRSVLYKLKTDKIIVIKSADKGSVVLSGIVMIILKKMKNNLEVKIFMRRCLMMSDLLKALYIRQLKKFGEEAT